MLELTVVIAVLLRCVRVSEACAVTVPLSKWLSSTVGIGVLKPSGLLIRSLGLV